MYTFNLTEPQLYSLLSMVLFDFIFPSRNRKNLLGHLLVDLGNQRPLPESLERAEDKCREALEAREARERQDAERAYTRNDRGPLQPPYWAR